MQQAILDQAVRHEIARYTSLFNPMANLFWRNPDDNRILAHMERCGLCRPFIASVRKAYRDLVAAQ